MNYLVSINVNNKNFIFTVPAISKEKAVVQTIRQLNKYRIQNLLINFVHKKVS